MASFENHWNMAQSLLGDMRQADPEQAWPVVVDAGYYAMFHTIEAVNALECRDSFTFADFADVLDHVLTGRIVDPCLRDAYHYLFYFRRGTIYGCHTPTTGQVREYAQIVEDGIAHVRSRMTRAEKPVFFASAE